MKHVVLMAMGGWLWGLCGAQAGAEEQVAPPSAGALTPVQLTVQTELEPLRLAAQGKALAPIVCPDDPYYRQIAAVLKDYLKQASGADFVVTHQPVPGARALFVGPCGIPSVKAVFEKAAALPAESLVVESVAEGLVLAGRDAECENRMTPKARLDIHDRNQSRGTFFAAVDFLERLVGLRFFFPGIGTHVPDFKQSDLVIAPVSYSDTPVFDMRALGYGSGSDLKRIRAADGEPRFWNTLLRLGDVKLRMAWHTDKYWHRMYGESNPEYFALRGDGSRAVGDRGEFSAYRCYSSAAGLAAHIAAIDAWYRGGYRTGEGRDLFLAATREFGPNRRYIHWGIADAFRGCECEQCLALTDRETPGGLYSKYVWRYVIDLAKACKERWPDKVLYTSTYGLYRAIPDFVAAENPGNLVIRPSSHGILGHSAAFLKEPKVWASSLKHLGNLRALSCEAPYIWEHYPHIPRAKGFTIPYLVPHYYQKYFSEVRGRVVGSVFNGDPRFSYALDSLMLYMMYKIHWNPDFDVDACVDEYCSVLFGPAAGEVGEYYHTLIDRWENVKWADVPDPEDRNFGSLPKSAYWVETYPRAVRDALEDLLRRALAKTEAGTIFQDRTKFLMEGTAPFFQQGRFFDLGKVYAHSCLPWTPSPEHGLRADPWRPVSLRPLTLARNDTGEPDGVVKAQIYLSYDATNLYIGGRIEQPDAFVTKGEGRKLERDSDIWSRDSLEIFLSTEQPGLAEAGLDPLSQYHQIIIDPDGSVLDGHKPVNGGFSLAPTFEFACSTRVTRSADWARFDLDVAIPFRELGCVPPAPGAAWQVNFYWNRAREGQRSSYAWAGTGGHHDTSRFGLLRFLPGREARTDGER